MTVYPLPVDPPPVPWTRLKEYHVPRPADGTVGDVAECRICGKAIKRMWIGWQHIAPWSM